MEEFKVRFPKGFLDTLSDKCKKELTEKASNFSISEYYKNGSRHYTQYTTYGTVTLSNTSDYSPKEYEHTGSITKETRKGFSIGELFESENKKLFDLENRVKELEAINSQLKNLKEYFNKL